MHSRQRILQSAMFNETHGRIFIENSSSRIIRYFILKETPHLNKNSHRLLNFSWRIQCSRWRVLQSLMPNKHPEKVLIFWVIAFPELKVLGHRSLVFNSFPYNRGGYKCM